MGRIDEALRRSNVDVGAFNRGPAPAPAPSPWRFEESGNAGAVEPAGAPASRAARDPLVHRLARVYHVTRGSFDESATEPLGVAGHSFPRPLEQFQHLAAALNEAQAAQPLKSVIVTSPSAGDGKTWVAVNLALTLSGFCRRRVLLIDADLRAPTLHRLFGVPGTPGLIAALTTAGRIAAVPVSDTLALLPAGPGTRGPLGSPSTEDMKRVLADASSRYDWVLVDSPSVVLQADARLVSAAVDGAILVARAGLTSLPDLDAAAELIGRERILALVLNAAETARVDGEAHSGSGGTTRTHPIRNPPLRPTIPTTKSSSSRPTISEAGHRRARVLGWPQRSYPPPRSSARWRSGP